MQAPDQSDPHDRYQPHISHLWPEARHTKDVERIPPHAKAVQFSRVKTSYRGIGRLSGQEALWAEATGANFTVTIWRPRSPPRALRRKINRRGAL